MRKAILSIICAASICSAIELKDVKLVAHQGEFLLEPPDTPMSVKKAYELGSKIVEFDVFDTDENQMVCFHGPNELKWHWGINKPPRKLTREDVKNSRYAHKAFKQRYPNQTIPTLEEILAVVPKDGMILLDSRPQDPKRFAKLFDSALLKAGLKRSQIIPTLSSLNELREISPEYTGAILFHCFNPKAQKNISAEELIAVAKRHKNAVHIKYIGVGQAGWGTDLFLKLVNDKDFFKKIKAAGFIPCAWTTDEPELVKILVKEYGVEFILTNRASWMRQQLGIQKDRK